CGRDCRSLAGGADYRRQGIASVGAAPRPPPRSARVLGGRGHRQRDANDFRDALSHEPHAAPRARPGTAPGRGQRRDARARPAARGRRMTGPLAGIRVVELTTAWAGPMAGRILAFLGAEVIHVEAPTRVNSWRLNKEARNPVNFPDQIAGTRFFDR